MSISITLPSKHERFDEAIALDKFLFQLSSSPIRDIIFFDEAITGFIVLKSKVDVQKYQKSSVSVNTSITSAGILEPEVRIENDKYNSDLINTTLTSQDIYVQGISNNEHYIIWKFEIPITYPKKKISNPNVSVTCFIDEEEKEDNSISVASDVKTLADYKPSHSRNLLSELNNQVLKSSENYQLTLESDPRESQSSIVINEKSKATLRASLSIPVSVSLVIKLKSTKPAGRNNILLSTLNIELSDELIKLLSDLEDKYYFNILDLSLDFKNGTIEELNSKSNKFPINLKLIDSLNLTYKLINNELFEKDIKQFDNNSNMYQFSKPINIRLTLQVQKYLPNLNIFENISNVVVTNWSPFLDFSIIAPPINNSLKTTTNYSQLQALPNLLSFKYNNRKNNIYKLKPPNSASSLHSGYQMNTGIQNLNISNPKRFNKSLINATSASSVTVNLTTNNNSTLSGLKLTFEGKLNLKLGEIVNWNLQAINNSSNRLNLSLVVQNPMYINNALKSVNNSNNVSSSNLVHSSGEDNEVLVYSKLQLYSLYHSLKLDTSGIVILNNDVRIGPLEPNSVFETSFNLIGISLGIFNLDGIKIFDTVSGDGLDFGKLVEVFVV